MRLVWQGGMEGRQSIFFFIALQHLKNKALAGRVIVIRPTNNRAGLPPLERRSSLLLDFPGVITWGENLEEARRLLASALVDMAETNLARGEALPQTEPACTDIESDLEEPIPLSLRKL